MSLWLGKQRFVCLQTTLVDEYFAFQSSTWPPHNPVKLISCDSMRGTKGGFLLHFCVDLTMAGVGWRYMFSSVNLRLNPQETIDWVKAFSASPRMTSRIRQNMNMRCAQHAQRPRTCMRGEQSLTSGVVIFYWGGLYVYFIVRRPYRSRRDRKLLKRFRCSPCRQAKLALMVWYWLSSYLCFLSKPPCPTEAPHTAHSHRVKTSLPRWTTK